MIERIDELEKALRKSNGRAVILVHPRFHLYTPFREADPRKTAHGRKYLAIQREVVRKSKLPVIVFEAENHVNSTKKAFGKKVFMVPAGRDNPIDPEPVEGWANLLNALRERGLKHGIFGGQKLSCMPFGASPEAPTSSGRVVLNALRLEGSGVALNGAVDVYGCVGGAMRNFVRRGLEVSLMQHVVFPKKLH